MSWLGTDKKKLIYQGLPVLTLNKVSVKYMCKYLSRVLSGNYNGFYLILCTFQDNDEDKLEEDELPEWKREPPKVDLSKLDPKKPEEMLQMSKKGRSLMMFATVAGEYVIRDIHSIDLLHFSDLILKLQWNLCNLTPEFSDIL